MPSRRKITLPDHVRRAVLEEICQDYLAIQAAYDRLHRRVYLGLEQGLIQEEIAGELNALPGVNVTRQAVSLWKKQGEQQTRDHSTDGRTGRPGEREPVG